MPGPGVDFGMSADASNVIRALDRIIQTQNKMIAGFQKASQETGTAARGMQNLGAEGGGVLDRLGGKVLGLAAGWLSVAAAVGMARKVISAQVDDLRRIHEEQDKITAGMTQALAQTGGMLGRLGEIERRDLRVMATERMRLTSVRPMEAIGAFQGIRLAAPQMAAREAMRLTEAVAPAKQAGFADLTQIAGAMGELWKVPGLKLGPEELASLATYLVQESGKRGTKLERSGWARLQAFGTMGLPTEKGIGMLLASLQAGGRLEPFSEIVEKLAETKTFPEKRLRPMGAKSKELTEEEKLERRFYAAGPAERLSLLQGDEATRKAVFGAGAPAIEAMLLQGPEALGVAAMERARGGYLPGLRAVAMRDKPWAGQMTREAFGARAEQVEYWRSDATIIEALDAAEAGLRAKGVPAIERKLGRWYEEIQVGRGHPNERLLAQFEEATRSLQKVAEDAAKSSDQLNRAAGNLERATQRSAPVNAHSE